MKDQLKEFIEENREEFDSEMPSLNVWENIDRELNTKPKAKRRFLRPWMGIAASILLAALAYWAGTMNGSTVEQPVSQVADMQQSDEFNQAITYYRQLISERKQSVKQMADAFAIEEQMLNDLTELDRQFRELKARHEQLPTERITNAMILNLQMQVRILNTQLDFLNEQKKIRNEPDYTQL